VDLNEFRRKLAESHPDNFENLSREQLEGYRDYFLESATQPDPLDAASKEILSGRISRLKAEIASRLREETNERRHQENQAVGRKTLVWAKWTVLAAAVVLIGIALLSDTRFTRFQPSTSAQASATPSPRTMPDDVLSKPSPTEKPPLTELLASPTPSPTAAPQ
jgi:hypothetical protein